MGPNQSGGPDSSSSLPNIPQGQGQGQGQIVGQVLNPGVDVNGPGQGPNHGNYQVPGGHLVPMYQQPQLQNGQGNLHHYSSDLFCLYFHIFIFSCFQVFYILRSYAFIILTYWMQLARDLALPFLLCYSIDYIIILIIMTILFF